MAAAKMEGGLIERRLVLERKTPRRLRNLGRE
jgi:hypothetical protein